MYVNSENDRLHVYTAVGALKINIPWSRGLIRCRLNILETKWPGPKVMYPDNYTTGTNIHNIVVPGYMYIVQDQLSRRYLNDTKRLCLFFLMCSIQAALRRV